MEDWSATLGTDGYTCRFNSQKNMNYSIYKDGKQQMEIPILLKRNSILSWKRAT